MSTNYLFDDSYSNTRILTESERAPQNTFFRKNALSEFHQNWYCRFCMKMYQSKLEVLYNIHSSIEIRMFLFSSQVPLLCKDKSGNYQNRKRSSFDQ